MSTTQKQVSRQWLRQIEMKKRGKCTRCANPALGKTYCPECYERVRARRGCILRRPGKAAWDAVDWSQSNSVIAKQMGVRAGAARMQRLQRGLPMPTKWWAHVDWNKTDHAIALETGKLISYVYWARARHGTKSPLRTRWETVDWSKSNRDIAVQLGVAPQTVGKNREKYANKTP